MKVQNHKESLLLFVTKLGHYLNVLGIAWLQLHDVSAQFASNTVTFSSKYCTKNCQERIVTIQGASEEPPEPIYTEEKLWMADIRKPKPFRNNIVMLNGTSFFRTVQRGKLTIVKASLHDINRAIEAKDLKEKPLQEVIPQQYQEFIPLFSK
jgi:hypothetical protein